MRRLETGGVVDRSDVRRFTLDGTTYAGFGGDTVASALLASGVIHVGRSIYRGRPRGILTAGPTEPNAFVQVESWPSGAATEPLVPMTTLELVDGLELRSLSGIGRLGGRDLSRYDARYVHVDVLVVGGGDAGLEAAAQASAAGERVLLVEERPHLAGPLDPAPDLTVLTRAAAVGLYDANYALVVEKRTDHLPAPAPEGVSRQRVWHVRARRVVLATGAHERPLVFADNDRPGVMLSWAVHTYLERYAVAPGSRAVVATVDDAAYRTALALVRAGVPVAALLDSRPSPPPELVDRVRAAGVEVYPGEVVTGTRGDETGRVSAVLAGGRTFEADLLAVGGGWSPDLHLFTQARGTVRWDERCSAFLPDVAPPGVTVVGAARDGLPPHGDAPRPVWIAGAENADPATLHDHFVDLHRDATVADVARAVGAGLHHLEHVKRYTTIGTGHDQGRTAGLNAAGLVAGLTGLEVAVLGATGQRPPSHPVLFAALAGREVGALADPVRATPIHPWHVAHGAVFEDVGQWKRPRFYPRDGESMDDAVLRECHATRSSVGMMDASTLGTIEIVGPDAPEFLNRMYTNAFAKLPVGSARYGLMCGPDGMVIDDGVTMRLAPDRYLMSTTTGNAAKILDWLEEWLQTEWPDLRVANTSATEQWSTAAVVGPRSRDVVARVLPGLDVSADAFGFMTFREVTFAGGSGDVAGYVARISFSGELAFELKVPGWYGLSLWEAVHAAGAEFGITPYGTEAMHVLRAEKGYPIIGQDTDGTVTPYDLGMSWIVSKAKDFVGKRSFGRPDASRPDRRHLVGLLPVDPTVLIPEGAQVVEDGRLAPGPLVLPAGGARVPMIGHVTSSYRSAALGTFDSPRAFALGLVAGGRDRLGSTVLAVGDGQVIPAVLADPVLYDPDGARRDGDPTLPRDQGNLGDGGILHRRSALQGRAFPATEAVTIEELPHLTQVNLRVTPGTPAAGAVQGALGFALPGPNRAATQADRSALWLGPDEWLLLGPDGDDLVAVLTEAVTGDERASVVDLSANRTTVRLRGTAATAVLEKGCALDLHARATTVDEPGQSWCAVTLLSRLNVILQKPGDDEYLLLVRPSFAGYLADWLLDAAHEFAHPPANP
ncbi:2Fe-2S iron-sulfur cluster-binding protein [Spongisporangium articulatum]|uniref:2Fe-2S iron-sulfur cluster-binding protein n=1 Tax=Spongisporangium articulatum TaxID=3362603 RepID=A0ABW8AJ46_9ACTN